MAKRITPEILEKMNTWFENLMTEFEESYEYEEGVCTATYLTIEASPFKNKWEMLPTTNNKYDICELLPMLDKFEFEEEGGPAWYVSRKTPE